MKKYLFLILLLCFSFVACEDDKDVVSKIQLSSTSCKPNSDSPILIDIIAGGGEYMAKSSDETVAIAFITDNKLYIWGGNIGTATITITDKDNNTATVAVEVNKLITRPVGEGELVYVKSGTFKDFELPFTQTENYFMENTDTSIASIIENGTKFRIFGLKTGEATITMANMLLHTHIYQVKVVDNYDLVLYPREFLNIQVGQESYFHVISGNDGYSIENSNPSMVTTEIVPYLNGNAIANPISIKVNALSEGQCVLTIKDKENKSSTINIRVYP